MNIDVKVGKDGVRYIRPYLGRNMATGKPMRPYKRFPEAKTDEEALAMAEPWLASVVPAAELGASASLGDMLNARLRELRAANAAPKTVETYESVLRNHIAPALGRIPYDGLKPYEVAALYTSMAVDGGVGVPTIRKAHNFLSGAYSAWAKMGLVAANPMDSVQKPRESAGDARALDEDEFRDLNSLLKTLLSVFHNVENQDPALACTAMAAMISEHSGARCGEVCGLFWRDFRPIWGDLAINHTVSETKSGVIRKEPKSKSSKRNVTISPELAEILADFKEWQRRLLASKGKRAGPSTPIVSADGGLMRPSFVSRKFKEICGEAGLAEDVHFHTLRHTFATYLIYDGRNLKEVQAILGHSSVNTTLNLYGHVLPGTGAEAARSFGSVASRIEKGGRFGQMDEA